MTRSDKERQKLAAIFELSSRQLAAFDARRDANSREQAMAFAARTTRIFRDGSPRDTPEHREIARRYAWGKSNRPAMKAHSTDKSGLISRVRLRELERLFSRRYQGRLPDNRAGRDGVWICAHHIAHLGGHIARHIADWTFMWAAWMSKNEIGELIATVSSRPLKFKAQTLGRQLRLSNEERSELGIRTIRPIDVSEELFTVYRKQKRAMNDRARQRAKGVMPRYLYESSSLRRLRPWEKLGMSRATWYRQGKP